MSRLHSLVASYRKRRFAFLFFSLLTTLGLHPIFEVVLPEADPTPWLFGLSLVAAESAGSGLPELLHAHHARARQRGSQQRSRAGSHDL